MNKNIFYFIILLLIFSSGMVFSQKISDEPAWVFYEKGKREVDNRELGNAVYYFQLAIEKNNQFPEVEMALGDLYLEEGEFALAEIKYKLAYDLRNYFTILDDRYAVLYKMVHLYKDTEQYKKMEDILLTILNDDANFHDNYINLHARETFTTKGFDQLLKLRRFKINFAVEAHAELGWFYYKTGLFNPSINHSLFSIIGILTECISFLREENFNYKYDTLFDFLSLSFYYQPLKDYFQRIDIFKQLYYLSVASYAQGYIKQSFNLWDILSTHPNVPEKYKDLSSRQIQSPWIEIYLSIE